MPYLEGDRRRNPRFQVAHVCGEKAVPVGFLCDDVVKLTEFDMPEVSIDGYIEGLNSFFEHRGIYLRFKPEEKPKNTHAYEITRWNQFKTSPLMRNGYMLGLTDHSPANGRIGFGIKESDLTEKNEYESPFMDGYMLGTFARYVRENVPLLGEEGSLDGVAVIKPYKSFKDGFKGEPIQSEVPDATFYEMRKYRQLFDAGRQVREKYSARYKKYPYLKAA